MTPFLKIVADDLFSKFGYDMSKVAVVFPNKRAGLFFNEYLVEKADGPVWSPKYITISDLFRENTNRTVPDKMELVCRLYKVYSEIIKENNPKTEVESLDKFYPWGEILINDFEDIDKNMAEADAIFANTKDLREYDDYAFLTEEQEEAIEHFFQNFSIENKTLLQEKFLQLWRVLDKIYHRFNDTLKEHCLGYEGALYREVAENINIDTLQCTKYVFVGFNVLDKVEHTLFTKLNKAGMALFYWDYDTYYIPENGKMKNEAGVFLSKNLVDFPNEIKDLKLYDNLQKETGRKVEVISTSTESSEARYLPSWLRREIKEGDRESETAVVLCNEGLLESVLHSLPDDTVRNVNVTMGFPFSDTPIYSYISLLIRLQMEGYSNTEGYYHFEQVCDVLRHPYTRLATDKSQELEQHLIDGNRFFPYPSELQVEGDEFLTLLFKPQSGNASILKYVRDIIERVAVINRREKDDTNAFSQLYSESLFQAYTIVNRFIALFEQGELDVMPITMVRLFDQVMRAESIPFHGEPAIGLQVMGVLETRNLDFKNLIMLSVNEGNLPKSVNQPSFIPYNLRSYFGLTTIERKVAVYAYYFYRLMQRSEHITLMYNTASDGMNCGEASRFILQYAVESGIKIENKVLQADVCLQKSDDFVINKSDDIMHILAERFDVRSELNKNRKKTFLLSPTAINNYIDCPMLFYYKQVLGLRESEEVTSEIDAKTFGTVFHEVAQLIYDDIKKRKRLVEASDIRTYLDSPTLIPDFVDRSFRENFFKLDDADAPIKYNGIQLINREVIIRYIKRLLTHDMQFAPFEMIGHETSVGGPVTIPTAKGDILSSIGGIVDRMDIVTNPEDRSTSILRVVDYKTGSHEQTAKDFDSIFLPGNNRAGYYLQAFLYSCNIMSNKTINPNALPVAPALLFIQKAGGDDYDEILKMDKEPVLNIAKYATEFEERLIDVLKEIFDQNVPFTLSEDSAHCSNCAFKVLCNR